MPRIYRAMLPDGDYPKLGASARTLGVRVPRDIEPDQNGDVQPGPHGMSVAPSLRDLPVEWVPKRLRHLREGAIGPDTSKVWRHGEGSFEMAIVAPHLMLRPDRPDHGNVAPEAAMPLAQYEHPSPRRDLIGSSMRDKRMWTEPAFSRYELLLKRLHDLNLQDKLDSPEADLVRDDMEELWSLLSEGERGLLAGLSSDLYSFSGEEITRDSDLDKIELMKRAGAAYQNRDWREVLEALRFTHPYFPAEQVAYMRGRSWQQLGRPEPAFWFFDRAHKLAPSNRSYAFMRLDALFRAGHRQEAFAEAQQQLSSKAAPSALVFGAAKVIYDSAAGLPLDESRSLYESIVAAVSAALRAIDHSEAIEATMPQSLILSGRLHLALALERLRKSEEAMQAYADAIAHHPNSDELLMARALFLLRTDQHAAAQKDLDALIGRGTNLASAYLFRAHRFLMQKDYARCLEVADRGLRVATHTATRVVFLEWIAISLYEQLYERRASLDGVRTYLEAALSLDPMNENVRSNLQALDRVSFTSHPLLTTQVVPDPYAALQDLRNQLQPAA